MIVLICGDRHWNDITKIEKALKKVADESSVQLVIQGGADGADTLGRVVAEKMGIQVCTFHANWTYFRKSAGPIRNSNQIKFIVPHIVLAFHRNITKSKGTKDMVEKSRKAGIKVRVIA